MSVQKQQHTLYDKNYNYIVFFSFTTYARNESIQILLDLFVHEFTPEV